MQHTKINQKSRALVIFGSKIKEGTEQKCFVGNHTHNVRKHYKAHNIHNNILMWFAKMSSTGNKKNIWVTIQYLHI